MGEEIERMLMYSPFALMIYCRAFFMHEDVVYMKRAIEIARKGAGFVNPNPMVGAVIVKDGTIAGEGYHARFGMPHAEIMAIENAQQSVEGATLYVTLEPCNHFGKTPPCTDRIIHEKFSRVVFGIKDPNPSVEGNGACKMAEAGIAVTEGVCKEDIARLNEVYLKYIKSRTPFVVLKAAMTLDGKIATVTGESKWITCNASRGYVHELRHQYAGVMTGVETVIKDDPALTDRSEHPVKSHPLRIVCDSLGRTPLTSRVIVSQELTLFAVTEGCPAEFILNVRSKGKEVLMCPEENGKVDLQFLMQKLGEKGIDSILLEGGGTLNFSALRAGIVDKAVLFVAPIIAGGETSKTAVGGEGFSSLQNAIRCRIADVGRTGEDIKIEAYIQQ